MIVTSILELRCMASAALGKLLRSNQMTVADSLLVDSRCLGRLESHLKRCTDGKNSVQFSGSMQVPPSVWKRATSTLPK